MDARSENTLSMFFTTNVALTDNAVLWSDKPAFVRAVTRFREGVTALNGLVQERNASTKPVTADKRAALDALVFRTLTVAGELVAYAAEEDDRELLLQASVTESRLRRTRDTELAASCRGIHQLAQVHLADLVDFEVDAAVLADLLAKIESYEGKIGRPTVAKGNKKAAGQSLKEVVAATRAVLQSSVDKQMLKFRQSQPEFYHRYQASRVIVDSPGGHKHKNGNGNGNGNGSPP